jgi:hypothetical protein
VDAIGLTATLTAHHAVAYSYGLKSVTDQIEAAGVHRTRIDSPPTLSPVPNQSKKTAAQYFNGVRIRLSVTRCIRSRRTGVERCVQRATLAALPIDHVAAS